MNWIRLFCIILPFTMTRSSSAQEGLVFRTNLTDVLIGRYALGFEVILPAQLSVGMELDCVARDVFMGSNHPWYSGGETEKRGIVVEPQFRWYPGTHAGQGAYAVLSGFFGYARYLRTDEASWGVRPPEWLAGGASLQLGYQVVLNRFVLDGYAGGTWTQDKDMGIYYEDLPLFPQASGLRLSGGLRLGFKMGGGG